MPKEDSSRSLSHEGGKFFSSALHFEAYISSICYLPSGLVHQFCVVFLYKLNGELTHSRWIKHLVVFYFIYFDNKEKNSQADGAEKTTEHKTSWVNMVHLFQVNVSDLLLLILKYKENQTEKNPLMLKQFHAPPNWQWDGSRHQDSCLIHKMVLVVWNHDLLPCMEHTPTHPSFVQICTIRFKLFFGPNLYCSNFFVSLFKILVLLQPHCDPASLNLGWVVMKWKPWWKAIQRNEISP